MKAHLQFCKKNKISDIHFIHIQFVDSCKVQTDKTIIDGKSDAQTCLLKYDEKIKGKHV